MITVDLAPEHVDLMGIRAGDRNLITFTATVNGAPLILTGLTVTAQARETSTTDADLAAVAVVIDATLGRFSLAWHGDDVRDWLGGAPHRDGVWDCQVSNGTPGDALTIMAGKFRADMDATR